MIFLNSPQNFNTCPLDQLRTEWIEQKYCFHCLWPVYKIVGNLLRFHNQSLKIFAPTQLIIDCNKLEKFLYRKFYLFLNCVVRVINANDLFCIFKADGSVWCWGANKKGQLGFGKTSRNSVTPLQGLKRIYCSRIYLMIQVN